MKKAAILSMVLLLVALVTGALAGDVTPGWKALKETSWVGVLTFVQPDGTLVEDNATFTFATEEGRFLSGTIACKTAPCVVLPLPAPDGTPIAFSGIRNGNQLLLTAEGYSMVAVLSWGHLPKRGSFRPHLVIEGSHVAVGDTFVGTLVKQ